MFPGDDVHAETFARGGGIISCQDDELDERGEFFRMLPPGKRFPLIAAHDPEKAVFRKPFVDASGGEVGIVWSFAGQFDVIDNGPRQAGGGEPEHFKPVLSAGRLGAGFVRGNLAGDEPDDVESERASREVRKMDVAEMDGIKRSSEEAGFTGLGHEGMVSPDEVGRKRK